MSYPKANLGAIVLAFHPIIDEDSATWEAYKDATGIDLYEIFGIDADIKDGMSKIFLIQDAQGRLYFPIKSNQYIIDDETYRNFSSYTWDQTDDRVILYANYVINASAHTIMYELN